MLAALKDERVAYCTQEGWLLLDDAGTSIAKTREKAEAFVAGALGPTTGPLAPVKAVAYVVVKEAEKEAVSVLEAVAARMKAREDARALFAGGEA